MPRKNKLAKPSFTAFLIPKLLPAVASRKKFKSLVSRQQVDLSRRFARECARHDLGIKLAYYLTGKRPAMWLVNNLGIKGLPIHYAARKKYIRDKLDAVISEIQQVVMIGAGFDTLCLEYHHYYPAIKFFELDQLVTQEVKLNAVGKLATAPASNLKFIACDLTQEKLDEVLSGNGYELDKKSCFIIEGVMMYLEKNAVEELLHSVEKIAAAGSSLIFGSMSDLSNENDLRAKFSDKTLAARQEKYKFAAPPSMIRELLNTAGFELQDTRLYHELQQNVVSAKQLELLKGERGEHYYFALKK